MNRNSQSLKDASESKNCNRKRKARELSSLCMISELPQEVISQTFSFQAHKDRLSVATTCNDLLKKVETFCERKWNEIGASANDTWEGRLSDTSLIQASVPPELLPHRYLLWKAYRTHLYTLDEPRRGFGGENLVPVADDKALLTFEHCFEDNFGGHALAFMECHLWDLPTRQIIKSFGIRGEGGEDIQNSSVIADRIIVSADDTLCIYTFDGQLVHRVEAPFDVEEIESVAADKSKVFFAYSDHDDSISCLDLATGNIQERVITWPGNRAAICMEFLVSGNMLLVLRQGGKYFEHDDDAIDHGGDGIYLFSLEDFSQRQFFPCRYGCFPKRIEDSDIVAACRDDDCIDVLKLKNGRISRTVTLRRSLESNTRFDNDEILLVTQSRVYVAQGDELGEHRRLEVYSAFDGKQLYTHIFDAPFNIMCAYSNRDELYVGFDSDTDGAHGEGFPSVRAYFLE